MRRLFVALGLLVGCGHRVAPPRAVGVDGAPLHVAVYTGATPETWADADTWAPTQSQAAFDYRAYTADVPTGFVFRPRADRPALREWFRLRATGTFTVTSPGAHLFYVTSDDGARVWIDGQPIVDNGPALHTLQSVVGRVELTAGPHTIAVDYLQGPELMELSLRCVRPDGSGGPFDTRVPW